MKKLEIVGDVMQSYLLVPVHVIQWTIGYPAETARRAVWQLSLQFIVRYISSPPALCQRSTFSRANVSAAHVKRQEDQPKKWSLQFMVNTFQRSTIFPPSHLPTSEPHTLSGRMTILKNGRFNV
ncbi:hypothetical protein J6590_016969 [Homalodisca vitripennis]|nr:hypothetical protein J6590_016969 [Homalodisca vitripennis]